MPRASAERPQPDPTPIRSVAGQRPTATLPLPLSSFVGREREVAALSDLLLDDAIRLVTLVGPGGVGKTRLAIRAADRLAAEFGDGVWFVPLASLREPRLVGRAIAQALSIREIDEPDVVGILRAHLRGRHTLLVLDNFEQLLDAATSVAELLGACPALTILATSRERLGVTGEQLMPVAPLSLPATSAPADEVRGAEAVRLFMERACAVTPGATLSGTDLLAVAELCRRLDGLPLAIELAAARIGVLPPPALVERIERRLPLLVGGPRDLPSRQQTMRATIAWSYDLLSSEEQRLLRHVAVFAAGFTLDAAERMMGSEPSTSIVLDLLASLVNKSLLRRSEERAPEPRFTMLETVREFALERLGAAGETDAVMHRFAEWCARFAELAEPVLMGCWDGQRIERIEAEHDNLRAALAWSIASAEAEYPLRITGSIWFFWYLRGYLTEAGSWLNHAVAFPGADFARARVKALRGASGYARVTASPHRATNLAERALELARASKDRHGVATAIEALGEVAFDLSDHQRAEQLQTEAVKLFRDLGDDFWAALTATYLASIASYQDDHNRAMAWSEDALSRGRRLGHPWLIANALDTMGEAAFGNGDYDRAAAFWREALTLYADHGRSWDISLLLNNFAALALVGGDPRRAARLFAASDAAMQFVAASPSERIRRWFEKQMTACRAALGDAAFAEEWEAGSRLDVQDAIAEAIAVDPSLRSHQAPPAPPPENQFRLSRREIDVLRLIAEGRTDQQTAEALFIIRRTVTSHVSSILNKLGVENRAAALAKAIRYEII